MFTKKAHYGLSLLFILLFFLLPNSSHASQITKTNVLKDESTLPIPFVQSIHPFSAASTSNQISIGADDTQNFFSTTGTAYASPKSDGTWNTITFTKKQPNNETWDNSEQTGAISLNMGVDMTKPVTFSWYVNIDGTEGQMADGIGFALHPVYAPGAQTILDSQDAQSTLTTPDNYGRDSSGNPAPTGQGLNALGLSGGDLGLVDMMNVMGFKLDTYYNGQVNEEPWGDSYYGNVPTQNPEGNVQTHDYFWTDPKLSNWTSPAQNDGNFVPFGSFFNTRASGYGYYPYDGSIISTPQSYGGAQAIDGSDSSGLNVIGPNTWTHMTLAYNPGASSDLSQGRLTVTLTQNGTTMSWSRYLLKGEQENILNNPYWSFSILGSCWYDTETAQIRDVSGTFTPQPSIIIRHTDENGANLPGEPVNTQLVDTTSGSLLAYTDPLNTYTYTPTSSTNSVTYTRAQLNAVNYSNGERTSPVRIPTTNSSGISLTESGNTWSLEYPYSEVTPITFLNFVYRRNTNQNSDITPAFQLQKYGGKTWTSKLTGVQPGDKITFKYSATLNNLTTAPASLTGVHAAQVLPSTLKLDTANSPDVTQPLLNSAIYGNNKVIYIPLTDPTGDTNLTPGVTGTNTATFIYDGVSMADITIGSNGQISLKPSDTDTTMNKTKMTFTTISTIYIYDQSQQLVDENGKQQSGSYYLDTSVTSAPLASNQNAFVNTGAGSADNDLSNYIPQSSSASVSSSARARTIFHYWDVDAASSMLPNSSTNTPTDNLAPFTGSQVVTGMVNSPVEESNLTKNKTPLVDGSTFTGNETYAPAPQIPNYNYLGYYAFNGQTAGKFVPYNANDPSSSRYSGFMTTPIMNAQPDTYYQSVAFIYRKATQGLQLNLANMNLDFGSHALNDHLNLPTVQNNSIGVSYVGNVKPEDPVTNWSLYLASASTLKSTNSEIKNATIQLPQPNKVDNTNVTSAITSTTPLTISLGSQSPALIMSADNTIWPPAVTATWNQGNIKLNVPTSNSLSKGNYSSTLNWQLTQSVS